MSSTGTDLGEAAAAHRYLEPIHSMIYFAPEAAQELEAVGLRPGRMPYFASRSAPMGAVGPGVVAATFYNFNPAIVARHIPRAWTLAEPSVVVQARFIAVDRALHRLLGDEVVASADVAEAADLATRPRPGVFRRGARSMQRMLNWTGHRPRTSSSGMR